MLAALAAGALGACGGESGDLLAIEVTGGPRGGERALVVTEDGRGRCDGSALSAIPNERLIETRELERELTELAEDDRRPTAAGGRDYVVRFRDGAARWSELTEPKPEVLARLELLALQLGRDLCRP